jgi:hypothetical protein
MTEAQKMTQHNFKLVNGDTDSIAFKKADEKPFTPEERAALLEELNRLMPEQIVWKDDDYFRRFIVLKSKHYILDNGKSVKIKGGGLKAPKKEPALRAFIREVIDALLTDRKEQLIFMYARKAKEIMSLKDITDWCFRVTVTKKVLEPSENAGFQKKQKAAIGSTPVLEGDRLYMFYREDESLCLREEFSGDYNKSRLLEKLKDTLNVFDQILDLDLFPNFGIKRNAELLDELAPGDKSDKPPKVSKEKAISKVMAEVKPEPPIQSKPKQAAFPDGFWQTRGA